MQVFVSGSVVFGTLVTARCRQSALNLCLVIFKKASPCLGKLCRSTICAKEAIHSGAGDGDEYLRLQKAKRNNTSWQDPTPRCNSQFKFVLEIRELSASC